MLHERLKSARLEKGYTQLQVSNLTSIGNKTISDYERGITEPDAETIAILATLYDVSTDYLLCKTRDKKHKVPVISENDIKVALFDGDKDVTDEMWEEVKSFARFVKQKHKKDNE